MSRPAPFWRAGASASTTCTNESAPAEWAKSTARALVLELVEGETLAERIARGPLAVSEALPLARQMAEALEAAHEKGIVHRDLKPANIKVTAAGAVKVLDFGLAKAVGGESAVAELTAAPTITRDATREGLIVGTAAYMSPEQARGQPVDRRTDIWAFGCVLYEMLTGRPPFAGATVSDTISAILEHEPDWKALPTATPPTIRRLLKRCLEKDRRRRLQAIGDARLEIEELRDREQDREIPVHASPRTRLLPWAVAMVLLGAVGVFLWTERAQPELPVPAQAPSTRLDLALPAPLGGALAMSRDGTYLIYASSAAAQSQLYLRDMSTGATRAMPGTRGARAPFFSPDGRSVGFFADGKLKTVAVTGGEPVVLADAPLSFGGAWAPDDTIYFNAHEAEGLFRIFARGGQAESVTRGQDMWPEILPDGNTLLFTRVRPPAGPGIYSLRNGQIKRLVPFAAYARYVPTGHILYGEDGKLLAVPFDAEALEVTGPPVTLFDDLRTAVRGFGFASFAVSHTGLLVYAPGEDLQIGSLAWVDHKGMLEPVALEAGTFGTLSLSPDGNQIAIPIFEGRGSDIWLYDVARGTRTRFTHGLRENPAAFVNGPRWTPSGQEIVYTSVDLSSLDDDVPKANFMWKPADGSREAVPLLTTDDLRGITRDSSRLADVDSFAPDGSALTFFSWSPATGFDLWLLRLGATDLRLASPPRPEAFVRSRFNEAWGRVSPDGRWIAYMSNESGRYEVYVRPYPGPGARFQISSDGGMEALWHPTGRQLFYRSGARYFAVDVRPATAIQAGKPRLLFERASLDIPGYELGLSPDGERMLIVNNPQRSPMLTLTAITNTCSKGCAATCSRAHRQSRGRV